MEQWNTIAATLNRIAYDKIIHETPCFFYSGSDCTSYFRDNLLNPYLKRKGSSLSIQSEDNPNQLQGKGITQPRERNTINQLIQAMTNVLGPFWKRLLCHITNHLRHIGQLRLRQFLWLARIMTKLNILWYRRQDLNTFMVSHRSPQQRMNIETEQWYVSGLLRFPL